MAAATSRYSLAGTSLPVKSLRHASKHVRASPVYRLQPVRVAADAPVDTANATGSSRYAIVNLGGMQQLLWEGQTYACSKQAVRQAEPGSKVTLDTVLALKQGRDISWGKPYLQDVVVEAEVMEDFAGPVLRRTTPEGASVESPERLSRFLVTKIVSGEAHCGIPSSARGLPV